MTNSTAPAATHAIETQVNGQAPAMPSPEVLAKIQELRTRGSRKLWPGGDGDHEPGQRYRHQSLGDLTQMVLEPLIRDRIAIARPAKEEPGMLTDIAGFAIWASVSEEVPAKIREQIKAGTFPVRLKPDDWQSGSINWLLDVIAPDRKTAGRVIANFAQVVKTGELRLHPQIGGLVEKEMLEKMGAAKNEKRA